MQNIRYFRLLRFQLPLTFESTMKHVRNQCELLSIAYEQNDEKCYFRHLINSDYYIAATFEPFQTIVRFRVFNKIFIQIKIYNYFHFKIGKP